MLLFYTCIEMKFIGKEKAFKHKHKHKIFNLFLHMLLKFEIIWTRIGQVIRLRNDIHFPETPYIYITHN